MFKQMPKQPCLHQTITQYVLRITFHVLHLYHDGHSITDKAINVHLSPLTLTLSRQTGEELGVRAYLPRS